MKEQFFFKQIFSKFFFLKFGFKERKDFEPELHKNLSWLKLQDFYFDFKKSLITLSLSPKKILERNHK